MKKKELKDEYELDELPEGSFTSVDLQEWDGHLLDFLKQVDKGKQFALYTQVDGKKDRLYLKGLHYVNATGVYAIVPKPSAADRK